MKYDEEYISASSDIKNYSFTEQNIKWLELLTLELKNIANELSEIRELWENK